MRKVVVSEFLTLDGVMEEPTWTVPYRNDESAKFKYNELFSSDALLLGRVTYQGFAQAWPSQTDEQGFADRMNSLPKYVVSTTLDKVEWNNSHLIKANLAEEINRLKQQPGENILVYGSATLVRSLMQLNLVDQYNLLVFPLVLGSGKRLFNEGEKANLTLAQTQAFPSGVVALTYTPDK